MFTARFHIGPPRPRPALAGTAGGYSDRVARAHGNLPMAVLSGLLVLGLPATSPAQGLGTMQVAAQVVPASAAWTGLAEAAAAARGVTLEMGAGRPLIRRTGVVYTRAEILPWGGRRLLLVTIHHPHN